MFKIIYVINIIRMQTTCNNNLKNISPFKYLKVIMIVALYAHEKWTITLTKNICTVGWTQSVQENIYT